jgi:hypothetical protein
MSSRVLAILALAMLSVSGCGEPRAGKGYRGPVSCAISRSGDYCLVLDEVRLREVGIALQSHPQYWCPPKAPDPQNHFCHIVERGKESISWFKTVPSGITIRKQGGAIAYVELLYTYNEFDRLVQPMQLQFGQPSVVRDVQYRNNTAPSRARVWETDETYLQLFDNSASTSVQITFKRPARGT